MPSISSVLTALTSHAPGEPLELLIALIGVGGTIGTNATTDQATFACTSCSVIRGEGVRSALTWLKERVSGAIDIGGCRIVADRPIAFVRTGMGCVPEFDITAHEHSLFVAGTGDGDGVAIYVADVGINRLVVAQFDFGVGAIELRRYANATREALFEVKLRSIIKERRLRVARSGRCAWIRGYGNGEACGVLVGNTDRHVTRKFWCWPISRFDRDAVD